MENEAAVADLIEGKVPARGWDGQIAELARRQHGMVARAQLGAMGMGEGAIEGRVKRGQLHPFHRGVYKVGYRRIGRSGEWMAAVLASGSGACLSHRSAARLWRLIPPGAEWAEITCPPPRRARRNGIVCHEGAIAEDEREVVDEIAVTSPFRTIFDLAAILDLRELERAFHEAEVQGLRDRVSLPMLLERYPGRRGARSLRAILGSEEPVGVTRNDFEEAFLALVDARGLPRPRMNADLAVRGRFFEIDALWEQRRVAVELDSRSVHGAKKRFESDRQRDRILVAEGWNTMRVTWRQLQKEPDEIAADLSALLLTPHGARAFRALPTR
ncbi:MAG TPA: type IV toxin-antitoxin system AbiEi family antitoxin domain-containing protein [Solirubrobacterales bacterium]